MPFKLRSEKDEQKLALLGPRSSRKQEDKGRCKRENGEGPMLEGTLCLVRITLIAAQGIARNDVLATSSLLNVPAMSPVLHPDSAVQLSCQLLVVTLRDHQPESSVAPRGAALLPQPWAQ